MGEITPSNEPLPDAASVLAGTPEAWVLKFAPLIPKGQILDLACGRGRHGRYFLDQQYPVTFLDQNVSGVADLASYPTAKLVQYDLENKSPWPFKAALFSGIIVTNYLHRPLFPHLLAALKPRGVLLYKTFSLGNEQFGKPRNPDYLLQENELLTVFSERLTIVDFIQGKESNPNRVTQAICGIKTPNNESL